jgi:hypothetical protein
MSRLARSIWLAARDVFRRVYGGEEGVRSRISILGSASCRKQYAIIAKITSFAAPHYHSIARWAKKAHGECQI